MLGVWGVVALAGLFAYYASQLPPIDQLAVPKRPPDIQILGVDGSVLADRGDTGGAAVRLSDLPPYLPKAFVAIEDRRFYYHFGVDPIGITRAVARDLGGGGAMQGGSTLTQQLAKNLFLTQERTMGRKFQEAILALWLERKYSKDQILELYLNRVYFGSGAYGVQAAARKYFGHDAKDVTLSEAALLAGLMKSPTKLAPNRNLKGANERAAQVIMAMTEQGYITQAMAKVALGSPAQVAKTKGAGSVNYAADYVMDALDDTVGAIDEDIVVMTTIDPKLQSSAERALTGSARRQGREMGRRPGGAGGARPRRRRQGAGRRTQLCREPVQPRHRRQEAAGFVVQAFRLSGGAGARRAAGRRQGRWADQRQGLVAGELQPRIFRPRHADAGIVLFAEHGGGAAGAGGRAKDGRADRAPARHPVRPRTQRLHRARHFGSDAARNGRGLFGLRQRRHRREAVRDPDRAHRQRPSALPAAPYNYGRVIEPRYVAMMNAMMVETLTVGTAKKADLPGWQAAGKTGTSQDWRDAWFLGYTSHLVAGVWLGNDDGSATKKVSGGNLPVEIWSRFMKEAHAGLPPMGLPLGDWRGEDAAEPAPPAPMAVSAGQPMAINPTLRRGEMAPPIPPANVGGPRDKNLLEKLFGEL